MAKLFATVTFIHHAGKFLGGITTQLIYSTNVNEIGDIRLFHSGDWKPDASFGPINYLITRIEWRFPNSSGTNNKIIAIDVARTCRAASKFREKFNVRDH